MQNKMADILQMTCSLYFLEWKLLYFDMNLIDICPSYASTDCKQALVKLMTWHWSGNKPSPEPMMAQFADAYMHHQASMS